MFWGRCSQRACRESDFAAISDFLGRFKKQLHIVVEAPNFQKDYTFDNRGFWQCRRQWGKNSKEGKLTPSFFRFCY